MKFNRPQNSRLLAAVMVTSLLVTSHAWQPVYRLRRRYRPEVLPVRLRALPHDVTLYRWSSVSVSCWVRVARWALNSFHVGFYMYYDSDTTLPVASNIPGVSVRPWPASTSRFRPGLLPRRPTGRSRYVTIGRQLTISWPTYRFIPHGTNRFCCTASILVNATREGADSDGGSGDVDNDVTLKPTRKFYSSYFRVHKVRF